MILILVAVYAFALGACFSAVGICWTSDYLRWRKQKRLADQTRFGKLALLAESNAADWRRQR